MAGKKGEGGKAIGGGPNWSSPLPRTQTGARRPCDPLRLSAPGVGPEAGVAALLGGDADRELDRDAGFSARSDADLLGGRNRLAVAEDLGLQLVVVLLARVQDRGDEDALGRGRSGQVAIDHQLGVGGQVDDQGRRGGQARLFLLLVLLLFSLRRGSRHRLGRSLSRRGGLHGRSARDYHLATTPAAAAAIAGAAVAAVAAVAAGAGPAAAAAVATAAA